MELSTKKLDFSRSVCLYLLDDTGVAFDEAAQKVYQLNTTATYIWCRLEEGAKPRDLAKDLADTFGFSFADAQRYVRHTLAEWRALGWFGSSTGHAIRKEPVPTARQRRVNPETLQPHRSERRYEILGYRVRVGLVDADLEDWVYPGLSHLEVAPTDPVDDEIVISVCAADGRFEICDDRGLQFTCSTPAEVAPYMGSLAFSRCIQCRGYAVGFHAGAVSDGDAALVLPGQAGSGKSTLTAALVHAGFRYLTDDLVLMRGGDLFLEGVPFGLCVKESGVAVLSPYFPALQKLRTHIRADGKRVRYLPPPTRAFEVRSAAPSLARWLVFPRYEKGAQTRLDRTDRGSALPQLIDSCTLSRPLSQEQVAAFVHWIGSVTCYHLTMGSLEEAVVLLRQLWRQDPNKAA